MIPLIKVGLPSKAELMPQLEKVLYSGMIAEGEIVYEFEKQFAEHFRLPFALGTSSGTASLHASLILAGVNSGDEVITTSMTAEPTNISIIHAGAIPVFADVDETSGNLDPKSVAEYITEKTKAIMVVHYAGIPVKMNELLSVAKKHNIPVVEDCAHALGSLYNGQGIGTLGDFGIFSLQAIKHMTTVDGGMLTFRDQTQMRAAKKFRWFGLEKGISRTEVDITSVGYKYNMNNVTAAIGLAQLRCINERIAAHKENGRYFDQKITAIPGLSVATFDECADPSYWLYTVLSDDWKNIEKCLASIGVSAAKLHKPNHLHSLLKPFAGSLPQLEKYYERMIHIPCGWWLSVEDREKIIDALSKG